MPEPHLSASGDSLAVRALDIARRHRALAVGVFLVVLASVVALAAELPDLYRAEALVLIDRPVAESVMRPAVAGELESRLHVIKQETLSRDRVTELMNRFNLYPELRARGEHDTAVENTRRDIVVEPTGPEQAAGRTKTVAFRLSYTGGSRETVAEVTNAIAAFYVAQNDKMRSDEATQTTQFLRVQLEEAKKELTKQEQNVRAFNNRHVGELPQQIELNLAALDRMNTQLRINGERQLRAMEERHRLAEDTMLIDSGSSVRIIEPDRARERLQTMQQDLQQMEARFTAKHPDVQRLRDEIALLERDLADAPASNASPASKPLPPSPAANALLRSRRNAIQSIDAELARLKGEDEKLRATITGLERKLESMPERQQEFSTMTRDHQGAKDLYDSLLKRFDEAQLVESMETDRQGERFRILESAIVPEGPSAPNRLQLILIGLMLAGAAAFMSVLVAEQFDTSFHSLDELRAFTRVPVLATIPQMASGRGRRIWRTALVTGCILLAIGLSAAAAAYLARDNEQLVRLLVRGA